VDSRLNSRQLLTPARDDAHSITQAVPVLQITYVISCQCLSHPASAPWMPSGTRQQSNSPVLQSFIVRQ
jgi:hypothetical protein